MKKIIVSCLLLLFALGCTDNIMLTKAEKEARLYLITKVDGISVYEMKYKGYFYIIVKNNQGGISITD